MSYRSLGCPDARFFGDPTLRSLHTFDPGLSIYTTQCRRAPFEQCPSKPFFYCSLPHKGFLAHGAQVGGPNPAQIPQVQILAELTPLSNYTSPNTKTDHTGGPPPSSWDSTAIPSFPDLRMGTPCHSLLACCSYITLFLLSAFYSPRGPPLQFSFLSLNVLTTIPP